MILMILLTGNTSLAVSVRMYFYISRSKEWRILQVSRKERRIAVRSFNTNKTHSYRRTGQPGLAGTGQIESQNINPSLNQEES